MSEFDAPAADALLQGAIRWWHQSSLATSEAQRARALDNARGQLRRWAAAGGTPEPIRPPRRPTVRAVRVARVELTARARTVCAGLRAELGDEAARLSLGGGTEFTERVRSAVVGAGVDLDKQVSRRLAALGLPGEAADWTVHDCLPAPRSCRLENRLSTLLGIGFGSGVAVTLGRVAADVLPGRPAMVGCGLLGVALTCWIVATRRLLTGRAAAERWAVEAVGNLRTACEERVVSRMLAAESDVSARQGAGVSDTPN